MNQNTTFLETDDMLRHYAALSEECSQIDNELYTNCLLYTSDAADEL